MWLNNFVEFERKSSRANHLVLGFYHESGKSVKVLAEQNVIIPSVPIESGSGALEWMIDGLTRQEEFSKTKMQFTRVEDAVFPKYSDAQRINQYSQGAGEFVVAKLDVQNSASLRHKLPGIFQKGSFDKLLRFSGFFPDRFVSLDKRLERAFYMIDEYQSFDLLDEEGVKEITALLKEVDPQNKFVQLDGDKYLPVISSADGHSLRGIDFHNKFIDYDYFSKVSRVLLDIEKPLWKRDEEKAKLDEREILLRRKTRLKKNDPFSKLITEINNRIIELERELTIEIPGIGNVPLYDHLFDARVSQIITRWINPARDERDSITELYFWDPNDEFTYETFEGADVVRDKTERGLLLDKFLPKFKTRRPLFDIAHNGAYDDTQLRFGVNEKGEVFDPLFDDVQPRRDVVVKHRQRLRQEIYHIDNLWLATIFFPFLGQRSLGSSFKLESVARHEGIDFSKIATHDELRTLEITSLYHPDKDARKGALEKIASYTVGDVGPLEAATQKEFIDFICLMKEAMPYLTLTEIAFSPLSARKAHEYHYFLKHGNIQFYKTAQKKRMDELAEFKKEFISLHKKKLNQAGIYVLPGTDRDIREVYVPIEEWISPLLFKIAPEFERAYNKVKDNEKQKFAFLQYLSSFSRDFLADYYFARREAKELTSSEKGYNEGKRELIKNGDLLKKVNVARQDENHFRRLFEYRYNVRVEEVAASLREGYQGLADSLKSANARVVDIKGRYLFVKSDAPVEGTYEVRRLPVYPLQGKKAKGETPQLEMTLR